MILKFNNGDGALCCERCNKTVMVGFMDYEWKALCDMQKHSMQWFCEHCDPNTQSQQINMLIQQVNEISNMYSKTHQKYLKQKYGVYHDQTSD